MKRYKRFRRSSIEPDENQMVSNYLRLTGLCVFQVSMISYMYFAAYKMHHVVELSQSSSKNHERKSGRNSPYSTTTWAEKTFREHSYSQKINTNLTDIAAIPFPPEKPVWTVLIHTEYAQFKVVNNQYLNLIKRQNYSVEIEFAFFSKEYRYFREPIALDDLVNLHIASEQGSQTQVKIRVCLFNNLANLFFF